MLHCTHHIVTSKLVGSVAACNAAVLCSYVMHNCDCWLVAQIYCSSSIAQQQPRDFLIHCVQQCTAGWILSQFAQVSSCLNSQAQKGSLVIQTDDKTQSSFHIKCGSLSHIAPPTSDSCTTNRVINLQTCFRIMQGLIDIQITLDPTQVSYRKPGFVTNAFKPCSRLV